MTTFFFGSQCNINLSKDVLTIGTIGASITFLSEMEAPKATHEMEEVSFNCLALIHVHVKWDLYYPDTSTRIKCPDLQACVT